MSRRDDFGPGSFIQYDPREQTDRWGLTLAQRLAYPVLQWIFFGQRASGRSVLMAHVMIRGAIETGREVWLTDHTEVENLGMQAQRVFVDTVRAVYARYYERDFEIDMRPVGRCASIRVWPRQRSWKWNGEWA